MQPSHTLLISLLLLSLVRDCDINLTMKTYTMLVVVDQAATVEALPPTDSKLQVDQKEVACRLKKEPSL